MKRLMFLRIHCTATKEGRDYDKETVLGWFKARGWRHPGYNDIIHLDGNISNLLDFDTDAFVSSYEISNGVRGRNSNARNVSYIGGVTAHDHRIAKDTRTLHQKDCLSEYVWQMVRRYPWIIVGGHNQYSSKACPSFDVPAWLEHICIPEANIDRTVRPSAITTEPESLFDMDIYGESDIIKNPVWRFLKRL